jgi:dolichol-phosphate mannosyltransferase
LIGIVAQIVLRFVYPHTPQGVTTVLVVILFLGSVQLVGLSVLGQYIGRIFEEVKQRPKFVVKSVFRNQAGK